MTKNLPNPYYTPSSLRSLGVIKSKMFQIYFPHSVQRFQPFTHIYTVYGAACYCQLDYFVMLRSNYLAVFYNYCKSLLIFTNSYHSFR